MARYAQRRHTRKQKTAIVRPLQWKLQADHLIIIKTKVQQGTGEKQLRQ